MIIVTMRMLLYNHLEFMRKILVLIISFLLYFVSAFSQEIEYITFAESFTSANNQNAVYPILPKEERLKNRNLLQFKDTIDKAIPDSMARCIAVAQDLWRNSIDAPIGATINIYYSYTDIDNDIETSVAYKRLDGIWYPYCLAKVLGKSNDEKKAPDAIIKINKNTKWDCGFSENSNNTKNLTYALLRSIAVSLGFGSSVIQKTIRGNDIIKFNNTTGHSIFDNLVFSSNNVRLGDIPNMASKKNQQLIDFATQQNGEVYVLKDYMAYKMYTPKTFKNGQSLVYLDNHNSLMNYELNTYSKIFQIDTVTTNVLKALGWKIAPVDSKIKIIGEDMDETGRASAYSSHHFILQTPVSEIKDAKWQFILPLNTGEETLISESQNSLDFNIPQINYPNNYQININGDIYGKIIFTGTILDKKISDIYYVTLELRPQIKNVKIERKIAHAKEPSYDTYFTVEYTGSNQLFVSVEEEYGTSLATQVVKEPFFAHVKASYITAPYYAWIDITAENKYGKDTYTIELPPFDEFQNTKETLCTLHYSRGNMLVEVYDCQKNKIRSGRTCDIFHNLSPGLYFVRVYKNNDVKTIKIYKQ